MIEISKQTISDMGDGNFGDGIRALKESGIYVYEPDKELGKYYISEELCSVEMRELDVHEVIPGWRFLLTGSYEEMGARIIADILGCSTDVILETPEYFRFIEAADDAEHDGGIKENNGSWYEPEI